MGLVNRILGHPLTRGLSVDDPRTTLRRRQIVAEKASLRDIYSEWYRHLIDALPQQGRVLELGSGAGFLKTVWPDVITSEVLPIPGVDVVADARWLPFADNDLDAIVMTDVFHHIPDVGRFMTEATRCIHPGGRLVMIEPWRSRWSEWVYVNLHPEPFVPDAGWTIPATGPLSGANGALPWIVFARDAATFAERYPQWRIETIQPLMPFSYLLSGGVSLRSLVPIWFHRAVRRLEGRLDQRRWAMFAFIVLRRLP